MIFQKGLFEFLFGARMREIPDNNVSKVEHLMPGNTY